jgi:hypothetical protein
MNSRVDWLIRLIPYNPISEPDLAVSRLQMLGQPKLLYTFVAPYNELRGYNVLQAVRMIGGNIKPRQNVSAIIFERTTDIIPANAKGLLQIVHDIQKDQANRGLFTFVFC